MTKMVLLRNIASILVACTLVAACGTTPAPPGGRAAPVETRSPESVRQSAAPHSTAGLLDALPAYPGELQQRTLALALLPQLTQDRDGWAAEIVAALSALRLPPSVENYCAAIAVIEQESGFQADPVVPGLSRIVWREIESRRQRYHIPRVALDAALAKSSPDGRSYRQRIDTLRTERQVSVLYGDIIDEVPGGKLLLSGYNPVRTGGPMQVSVAFAEVHAREKPYDGAADSKVRDAVFTRRGGLYFGIAHLLDYPASYRNPIYRFADFNAGHYSSRNAAFQRAVAQLSGKELILDGDLLSYENGLPNGVASATEKAVMSLYRRLRLGSAEITAGLRQEKHDAFARTLVYQRVFALADEAAGQPQPREILPGIELKSPKITRKITTAWFAERVSMRHARCMARAEQARDR